MNEIPNMVSEVIEAIHLAYEDIPDLEADCLKYILGLKNSKEMTKTLSEKASERLQGMNRCVKCGSRLYAYYHTIPNLEGVNVERLCPECDLKLIP